MKISLQPDVREKVINALSTGESVTIEGVGTITRTKAVRNQYIPATGKHVKREVYRSSFKLSQYIRKNSRDSHENVLK